MRKTKTKKQLEHEVLELKAQLAFTYHFASEAVGKLSTKSYMGSGVLVCLYKLGGNEACLPFVVRDGFSDTTINALKGDIVRSYELATMFKPKS
jgi:hypothetical protein